MSEKILLGKVTQRETPFGTVETEIALGPKDFEKMGIVCPDWKRIKIKPSKSGGLYAELNTWQPKPAATVEGDTEELPF
jgi:hypothetical protein